MQIRDHVAFKRAISETFAFWVINTDPAIKSTLKSDCENARVNCPTVSNLLNVDRCTSNEVFDPPGTKIIKLFYRRTLLILVKSLSVCPWQAFPAYFNVSEQGLEPTRVEHLTGSHIYYTRGEVNGSGKHSSLLRHGNNYVHKKYYNTGHSNQSNKTFFCFTDSRQISWSVLLPSLYNPD